MAAVVAGSPTVAARYVAAESYAVLDVDTGTFQATFTRDFLLRVALADVAADIAAAVDSGEFDLILHRGFQPHFASTSTAFVPYQLGRQDGASASASEHLVLRCHSCMRVAAAPL